MLLRGITWLVLFQLLGTVLNVLLLPRVPEPIIGMLLLFVFLVVRGGVSEPVSMAASNLLRYLPLLLVPPVAGVMAYWQMLGQDLWAIIGAMVISLLLALVFTGWLMQLLINRRVRRRGEP